MKIVKKLFRSYTLRLFFAITGLLFTSNINAGTATYENYPFSVVDYTSATHNYGGYLYNAPNTPNNYAFAALKDDGSIVVWGNTEYGGSGAPTDSGYTQIYSNPNAFAALKNDGSIVSWGNASLGGSGAPTDSGYVKIYSNPYAFAALKDDGSIVVWGNTEYGGSGAPTGTGFKEIYSNLYAFAALKDDGTIVSWGNASLGGSRAPTDSGYTKIYSTSRTFAALKEDGSITTWGFMTQDNVSGIEFPTDSGYIEITSTRGAFAALKEDGTITVWGGIEGPAPMDSGYTKIYATGDAFAALKENGKITVWGNTEYGGSGAPTGTGFKEIYSNFDAFAALKEDGTITAWGNVNKGGSGAPTDSDYTKIYSNSYAFAALKEDGTITAWGDVNKGGSGAPTGGRFTKIYSSSDAFVAYKNDGTIVAWGNPDAGGSGAPEVVASTDSVLSILPSETTVKAGESFDVSIEIDKAQDLYGVQSTILVDKPQMLSLSAISYGDLFDKDNRLEIPNEDSALSQATEDGFSIAISLKTPATPINGIGTFAKMTYTVPSNAYGVVNIAPQDVIFSNKDGQALANTFTGATVTITNTIFTADGKTINGTVTFPSNIEINNTAITLQNSDGDTYTTTVDSDGNFTISDLKDGIYTIYADQYPYFSQSTTITIQNSEVVNIGSLTMLSGDTNADNVIDIGDVTLIANYFGQNTNDIPSDKLGVDVNIDGVINIQDLAIVGNNFGIER